MNEPDRSETAAHAVGTPLDCGVGRPEPERVNSKGRRMHTKTIRWFGRQMVLACDGNCGKAWGISERPKVGLSDDPDDVAYLADGELGNAPADPGTYEGGCSKPNSHAAMNKWCARECERSDMALTVDALRLPNFTERLLNQPWKHGKTPNVALTGRAK